MFDDVRDRPTGLGVDRATRSPTIADDDLRWPIVRVRGELALIGAVDVSRATPWFTAYGRVGAGQLARLAHGARRSAARAARSRLVAIHHPPAGKRATSRIRGLRDHAAFAQVIAEVGADLIVHGHEHRDMTEALAGPGGTDPGARRRLGHLPPQQARSHRALPDLRDRRRQDRQRFTCASGTATHGRFEAQIRQRLSNLTM